jgi:DNA segregation ATPase FtsK/SpoIIIE-like protein
MFRFARKKNKFNLSDPNSIQNRFLKYKFEAIAIVLASIFLLLFISLISYNPADRSWFYFSNNGSVINNWCGIIGANFSALLFYLLGSAAYLFVFGFALFSYLLITQKSFAQKSFAQKSFEQKGFGWRRVIAFFISTLSFAALLASFKLDFTKSFAGGLIGSAISNVISDPLGVVGSRLFLFGMLLAGFISAARISLLTFIKKILVYSYRVLNITAYYLMKVIKKTFILLLVSIKRLLVFCWHKIKKLFSKKSKGNIDLSDDGEFEKQDKEFFTSPIMQDKKNFEDTVIYRVSRTISFDDLNFTFLPNTVFHKNIFEPNFAQPFFKLLETLKQKFKKVIKKSADKNNFAPKIEYKLPDTRILQTKELDDEKLKKELEEEGLLKGKRLEEKLSYFGIKGKVTAIRPGPVITLFEYKPEIDSKISKIISLEDDLALALMALSIRIVAPIPGRSVVGFEISNKTRQIVPLSNILNGKEFKDSNSRLPVVFGVDIVGRPVIQDLAGMPHLLVAGSTGSGKSVGMNAMLVSLLCNFSPEELKLILIDPKRLEFAPYKDIPHLLFPIITNPRNASPVLKWLVQEMERRYDLMAQAGVRNISEYQELLAQDSELEEMPFIVLMIDELADLMMVAGKDIELHIARIAQMARAAGIHMVVATQRPSVDVVTGLIKVNFPSRVAFRVTSKIDSRTIIDGSGAEKLLGRGDMLYMNSASSDLQRIHGAYVGVKEVETLTSYLRSQAKPEYLDLNETLREMSKEEVETIEDDLYPEVIDLLNSIDEISISGLQRKYRIGYNRSARLIEKLELDGFLAPAQGSKPRKVLKENL